MELFIMALQVNNNWSQKTAKNIYFPSKRGSFVGLSRQRRVQHINLEWTVGTERREAVGSPASSRMVTSLRRPGSGCLSSTE